MNHNYFSANWESCNLTFIFVGPSGNLLVGGLRRAFVLTQSFLVAAKSWLIKESPIFVDSARAKLNFQVSWCILFLKLQRMREWVTPRKKNMNGAAENTC
jgi:hypothetical protein